MVVAVVLVWSTLFLRLRLPMFLSALARFALVHEKDHAQAIWFVDLPGRRGSGPIFIGIPVARHTFRQDSSGTPSISVGFNGTP